MSTPENTRESTTTEDVPPVSTTSAPVGEPGGTPALSVATAAVVLLTVTALYFGRDIFLPFALAVLLSFMLEPLVTWLRRLRLPRVAAVVLVVTTAVVLLGALSVLVGGQVVKLANNLPIYQQTMQEKIRSIRAAVPGGGAIDRTAEVLQALGRELSEPAEGTKKEKGKDEGRQGSKEREPIPVRIEQVEEDPLAAAQGIVGPLLAPVGTAGLVIIFIFFVLLQPSDLRDRFIRLAGGNLHRTTEALNEAAERVTRYLVMQLVINVTYGLPLGLGLYMIGIPGAFLWGLLATLLRFIPYLGPVIAAFFPVTLAFAVDPGWTMLLWTVALVLVLELVSNNIIEPWLYGSSTGLTPVAVILSAIFWTLLWGPVGLILATPLTVCLVVMGRYVPQLAFLDVLLGSDPVLSPAQRLYQRLLADNVEEAIEIAETQLGEQSLVAFYNEVGIPALSLAEKERERGASREDLKKVARGAQALVHEQKEQGNHTEEIESAADKSGMHITPVPCIAGRGELDDAAAAMLVHALESKGIDARFVPASAVTHEAIGKFDLDGAELVCLVYLNPMPQAYARFVCRRIKRRMPRLKIVLATWNLGPDAGTAEQLAAAAGADIAAPSLEAAVRAIEDLADQPALPSMQPPPLPAQEHSRLRALQACGLLAPIRRKHLDRVAHKVADAFDTPIALVTIIDESCQLWKGAAGLPDELQKTRQGSRETSVCTHVVEANAPLVIEDTSSDPRFKDNPFLRENGMRFYAGAPLRTRSGHVVGTLCVIDTKPRTLTPREVKLLQVIADELMADLADNKDGLAEPKGENRQPAATGGNSTISPAATPRPSGAS